MKSANLKRAVSGFMALTMLSGLAACNKTEQAPETEATTTTIPSVIETTTEATEEALPYTFGLGETFHADELTTYTMFFSDASWYPMVETWETEGVFKKIEELTNVHLDIISYDSNDYMNNVTLDINAGDAAYIIPKIYDESAFVDGGAVVAVSDYVQYMPYYTDFYNTYNMAADLQTITKSNGKYYRLPGMLEAPMIDYAFVIRQDIFEAAGVDVQSMQATWNWQDLLDALIQVKAYMVENGMCSESDYIWSDLWCGNESGQGNGGNLLKVMGATYDVNAGWAIGDGMRYNPATDSFEFSPTSEAYKEFLATAESFINAGILDPETFTQDDSTATSKYYNGQTVIMSINRSQYATYETNMTEQLGAGNYENYIMTTPVGSTNYTAAGAARLENGVMLSQNALDDLGEEGFIELCRFVDWLFYSPEAYQLYKWGVEGETFEFDADGNKVLLPGYCCGGLGLGATADTDVDIRLQWGYACGNFYYGHTMAEMTDNLVPAVADYVNRDSEYRDVPPLAPGIAPTEDQNEQLNLIATPLIDNVNTWTLKFITGQADLDTQWEEYVASCEALNSQGLVDLYAEVYNG